MIFQDWKTWRERLFRYAPFLLWIAVIVYNSTSLASMSETSRFIRPLLEFLFPHSSAETLTIYHSYIRKLAHFTEYSVLAFFASRAFWTSANDSVRKYWHLSSFAVVLIVATLDEFNQSFNPTRTASGYDVFLDCIGGLTMLICLALYKRIRNN